MAELLIEHVAKSYGEKLVLEDAYIKVPHGEFVSLLGPSGCGKTTTLNIVAGFVAPDSGSIRLGGDDITRRPPYGRDTAIVFQNYALFPHMRVTDNVAYGLRARRVAKDAIAKRVEETLRIMGIHDLADRFPSQLSGGQQQRVAVARAVAVRPSALLMDEPLSNLDAKLRAEIRIELRELQHRLDQTILFVTHDQEEALSMSDRIVLMNRGRIEQIGSPDELFQRPKTVFAAGFMGVENIVDGAFDGRTWASENGTQTMPGTAASAGAVGIRPSELELVERDPNFVSDEYASVQATVTGRTYLGDNVRYELAARGDSLVAVVPYSKADKDIGDEVDARVLAKCLIPLEPSVAQ
ncbi:ABC transporter ATP-binding protein [Microbacterium sp. MPKO10]|uniref:ABC transporter ATP-binding protein n=1 Tax=Microbacterium sp. MPKO10 TaxID=2989818 RepID=UPI002235B114|nr:ABC transporter ATP-binding protein [Microbacterium sp. MPKO10]MCW4456842.1 ABC transporter ATP-binding protein [Microbacterium sp. MPKO10]